MAILVKHACFLCGKDISSYCNIFIPPVLLYQVLCPHAFLQPFLYNDFIITAFTMVEKTSHCALIFKLFNMCSIIFPFTCSTWILQSSASQYISALVLVGCD